MASQGVPHSLQEHSLTPQLHLVPLRIQTHPRSPTSLPAYLGREVLDRLPLPHIPSGRVQSRVLVLQDRCQGESRSAGRPAGRGAERPSIVSPIGAQWPPGQHPAVAAGASCR